jgi:hypothetical protein
MADLRAVRKEPKPSRLPTLSRHIRPHGSCGREKKCIERPVRHPVSRPTPRHPAGRVGPGRLPAAWAVSQLDNSFQAGFTVRFDDGRPLTGVMGPDPGMNAAAVFSAWGRKIPWRQLNRAQIDGPRPVQALGGADEPARHPLSKAEQAGPMRPVKWQSSTSSVRS